MRPYMLYLARFYARNPLEGEKAAEAARAALDDWTSYQTVTRWQIEAYRR